MQLSGGNFPRWELRTGGTCPWGNCLGAIVLGEIVFGGNCPRGIIRRVIVLGGNCPGSIALGGKSPGGNCTEDNCPVPIVSGTKFCPL